jgi:VCBS repeat-containing protein
MQAVIVNLADLSGVLSETATVPATGELLTGAIFGADGPGALKIVSIAHDADGDPGTPDAVYDTSSAGYNAATKTLTITTHEGGTLSVNFETGAYNYIAPENVAQDTPEVFKYTIQDADGDTATANLTITVLDGVPAAAPDTATAAEGYWKTGGNVTYTDTITVPASWSAGTSEHDVDGKWEIDPSYWLGSTVKTISTPTFSLNADAGHPTSVSVYLHVQGYQSGDWVKVELINNSGTVIDTVWGPASNPNVTFSGITQSGTYYLKLSGDDNSSNGNLYAYIKDVSYDSYTYTPETSIPISVTAPDLAWQAAVAATGNVISNDAPGTDGGLVVTEVDGITVTAGGVDITGDYGTLHIHPDGSFTYTPSASDLPSGSSDEFSYTIQDADGSPSIATLTVNITDHAYSTTGGSGSDYLQGTSGNDTLTGNAGNDYLSGGDGNDILVGGTGNDHLVGGSGDDNLSGGDGTDILEGGAGIDILSGGAGSDYLSGGDGNDTLPGGTGNDILAGGTGADTFVFSEKGSANMDLILDYSAGDKIDLSSLINIATGKTVADYVKVEQIGSDVKVSVNTAGSGSDWSPVAILDGYGTGGTDLVKVLIDGNEHEFNV